MAGNRLSACTRVVLAALFAVTFNSCAMKSGKRTIPRNDEVKWEGSYVGLVPSFDGFEYFGGASGDAWAVDELLGALDSNDRFVAAHVLLTSKYGKQPVFEGEQASKKFNGLPVNIGSGGIVSVDVSVRKALRDLWVDRVDAP